MNPEDPRQTEAAEAPPSASPAFSEELPHLGGELAAEPELEPALEEGTDSAAEAAASPVEAPGSGGPGAEAPGKKPEDRRKLYVVVGVGVAALLLLAGLASLWRAHSELGTLRRELDALKVQSRRAQVQQERAAILRVRAELQALRRTVPADLAAEVDKADTVLTGVDERLKALQ